MQSKRTFRVGATFGAVALLTAGCLSDGGGGGGGGSSNTSNQIEVMYAFTAGGKQETGFKAEVDAWAKENDVEIEYSQAANFNQLINTRVQGNDAPDVAIFPQPGIMREMAADGLLADLSDVVDSGDLESLVGGAVGQVDGTQYAVPVSINIKSIVFYPKEAFEAKYQAPETFDDLLALTDQIQQDGTSPWCFGIESQAATGWPATDWIENLILIQQGPDFYNQWVNHEVPFNSPEVGEAVDTMEQLLLEDGRTNGGRKSIASNNFLSGGNPLFDDPPGCYMFRQGNFVTDEGGFPEDVLANLDERVGVFPMPGETAEDKPVLGGGDLAGIFSTENQAAQDLVKFLTSSEFGTNGYGETGAWISPRKDFDTSVYPNETLRSIADIGYQGTEFAFDGSDQMPGEVGSGTFWRDMTAYISGSEDAKTALDNIESSWPA
jgi:alpha-glucoside transport system substrate-binding protein